MRIGVLSNIFKDFSDYGQVEKDLMEVGKGVIDALKEAGHEPIFFDVNEKTFEKLRKAKIDMAFNVCERFNDNSFFEPHVAAMLELLGIPYTGSGPLTLALCMNKVRVKDIMVSHGIPTPKYQVFYSKNKKLRDDMRFPLIVKPSNNDNSIGITEESIVHDDAHLKSRVAFVNRTYNQPALVEEFIEGRDLDVGVLGNGFNLLALPLMEITYKDGHYPKRIFDYTAKWDTDTEVYKNMVYKIPKDIPKYLEVKIKRIATELYRVLELRDYGRVDIRLSADNVPYVLEVNPNPGISCICSTPKAAKLMGMNYSQMICKILDFALERHGLKEKIIELNTNPLLIK